MPARCLYLSRSDVEAAAVEMSDIIEALEVMFLEKSAGRVEMPPKPGIHPQADAFIHAMPAFIPALKSAGVKWVGGYPGNPKSGLPYISGFVILNDADTGLPISVMDCTWITAKRTGAATAVAAKHLARENSRIAGILGCGVQGRSNLEAVLNVRPVDKVVAYDILGAASERFAAEMHERYGLEVVVGQTPENAVRGCDIVITAGPLLKVPHATILPGWLEQGAFASLVDYDSYWSREALREVDKFCTDDIPQLEYYRGIGYFQDIPSVYSEISDLVAGRKAGRVSEDERTMTCNLGLALEDMTVAPLVYRRAVEKGIGTWLDL